LKKDSVIWLSGTLLGIPVVKALITPKKVSYYTKYDKVYFEGDFAVVNSLLKTDLNFQKLQNLLFGEAVVDLDAKKYRVFISNKTYLLIPEKSKTPENLLLWIYPKHFKINREEIRNRSKQQFLSITYGTYQTKDSILFPKNIEIKAVENLKSAVITMEYRSVSFDKALSFPFEVPEGYTKIEWPFEFRIE